MRKALFCFVLLFSNVLIFGKDFSIENYGAVGDAKTVNTQAIQKAIDDCNQQGGGRVIIPKGTFISGTILLKDNVLLYLDAEATLLGNLDINNYQVVDGFKDGRGSNMGYCFIGANDAKNTGITGKGKIDGNGKALLDLNGRSKRPFLVRFVRCINLTVTDVQMQGPAAWTMHLFACKEVKVERVIIRSRGLGNNDGIDIDCCQNVEIKDCDIDSGDDAICFKTTGTMPCKNITISGCKINTGQGAFKICTESIGDFENINISNCTVLQCKGIKIYSVDGGHLKNLKISNISIEQTTLPIMIRLGARLKTFRVGDIQKPVGSIKNITISNIQVQKASQMAVLISGIPNHNIENVKISNVSVNLPGGGTVEDATVQLAENIADYPEVTMFGKTMPAAGIYVRHVNAIQLHNIAVKFEKPDFRPSIIAVQVQKIGFKNIQILTENTQTSLKVEGESSKDITADASVKCAKVR